MAVVNASVRKIKSLFSAEDRIGFIERATTHLNNVRVEPFEPAPRIDLAAEHVTAVRWWTADELRSSQEVFGPRRLPELVTELLESGPRSVPLELGK